MPEAEFEEDDPVLDLADEIVSLVGRRSQAEWAQECPYYTYAGTCRSGCRTEPICHTDEPIAGWAGDAQDAREQLALLLAPALSPGSLLAREAN